MRDAIRSGCIGLAAAVAFSLLWAGPAVGREGAGPEGGPASTITLTRVVPVYEFENLKVPVERYQVAAGDSLAKILKARGLTARASDQARLMRLVRELNPELKNLNRLAVGQVLNLPASSGASALEPAAIDPVLSPGGTETVKIYERPQPDQQAARVVVLRHQVSDPPAPDAVAPVAAAPAAIAPTAIAPETAAPIVKAAGTTATVESAPAPAAPPPPAPAGLLDFPSGNAGPLAQAQGGLVYRTVKVRPGDTLERLLRREGLPREAIYRHLLKITLDLNPEIKNPDLILAGTELRIPAAGDYLSAAGLDPHKVREAALAISQRRRPPPVQLAAGTAENIRRLPVEEAAKNTLGLLFTRLGDRVENQGTLMLEETLELDARAYPVIHTLSGAKVALDLGSTLPQSTLAALRSQNFHVFRTRRGETLDRVLGNLWPLCGYYRVYGREQAYEGGGDIRLRISADWIIWPTEEAWNSGQPLVLNRVGQGKGGRGTDPAWSRFLGEHGLTVLDLERDIIRPAPETPLAPPPAVTALDSANPRFLAAELVRLLKAEPRPAVPLEMKQGAAIVAPLYWETGGHKVILSFGELSPGEVADLRKNGYRVAAAGLNTEAVIEAVLTGFGLKAQENLTLTAPAGGPRMTLTIKGRLIASPAAKERYFLTYAALPEGLVRLMDPDLKIIRY